jgi:heme-degrading monooxygenase HmoA
MFARLTTIRMKSDRHEEFVKIYEESVIPAAQLQKGYRGAYLLTDYKANKGILITLWNNEEDAIANEQSSYYQEQIEKFIQLIFSAPPVREGYNVSLRD